MEALHKLIKVHRTRKRVYEKAIKETKEDNNDLSGIFRRMADVSHIYSQELSKFIVLSISDKHMRKVSGEKIYYYLPDIKPTGKGNVRRILLGICKSEEDNTQTAYDKALDSSGLSSKIQYVLIKQREVLKASSNLIKDLIDEESAAAELKSMVPIFTNAETAMRIY